MSPRKLPRVGWGGIVMTGAELIAERGIARLELADIAARLEVEPSEVSYWFEQPGEVLVAVMEIRKNWFLDEARARMATRDTYPGRLRELIEMTIADRESTYWIELWKLSLRDESAREARQRLSDEYRRSVAAVIRAGQREGEFGSASPDKAALVLSSLLTGFSVNLTLNDPDVIAESTLGTMLDVAERLLDVELTGANGSGP
jgi:AcrR family transcriptional regulator